MAQREVCIGCDRPPCVCYCDLLPSPRLSPGFRIHCVQHPNEAKRKALSSVPLLAHALDNFTLEVADVASAPPPDDRRQRVLLFPGPTATLLSPRAIANLELVVVDGTWKEAKRIVHMSPSLQALPRVLIACDSASLYGTLRKEPKDGCVSTLEAVAQAITVLSGDAAIQATLLSLFGSVVGRQTAYVDAGKQANAAYYNGVPKPERTRTLACAKVVDEAMDADVREYVFYMTETRLDGSSRWHLVGDAFRSTYSAAMRLCVESNIARKRGDRIGVVLKATYEKRSASTYVPSVES
ncbi:hypothetical protein SPRG_21097 [Saprolegnia parasitica CBS 223.65]|uniref:tRNA-uridine aminocarboxypropyltransferase n=1 Tax=Saprolegnia parasitica (strain CBS 223.65) TaxID=695850 RepID=A0A067BWW9_SAPPC|nr:hypothetical protein SPRG_21097 [Saprolegnia parasitica CBS 223.65]KDO22748.1 hypothetical protein SPRG_21097 [Saprolegnia parasitica CBS 223.65]|eukprot:XP_012206566.1 hypothetical protein SPRG_21097 [Saprolegnia parasitica CBS 223.65]